MGFEPLPTSTRPRRFELLGDVTLRQIPRHHHADDDAESAEDQSLQLHLTTAPETDGISMTIPVKAAKIAA